MIVVHAVVVFVVLVFLGPRKSRLLSRARRSFPDNSLLLLVVRLVEQGFLALVVCALLVLVVYHYCCADCLVKNADLRFASNVPEHCDTLVCLLVMLDRFNTSHSSFLCFINLMIHTFIAHWTEFARRNKVIEKRGFL